MLALVTAALPAEALLRRAALAALMLASCAHAEAAPTPSACIAGSGLPGPLAVCSLTAPCQGAMDFERGLRRRTITEAMDPVRCMTSPDSKRPPVDDGPPLQLQGIDGTTRLTCVHRPPGAGPRPLLIVLHGAGGSAQGLYDHTSLRVKSDAQGFVLAFPQGRNLHWPSKNPPGPHWDHYFRDASANPDVRYLDALIDKLVADGAADPQRIYVVGWSNGGRFAQLYGLLRHATPSAGGHRVAAVASYAGASPLDPPTADTAACGMALPQTDLPVLLMNRSCDGAMGCDAKQAADFDLPPGSNQTAWRDALAHAGAQVTLQLYDSDGKPVPSCDPRCHRLGGLLNHVRWPDGIDDNSGRNHEPELLDFLRAHPLNR